MQAKDVKLKAGMQVKLLTGKTYTIVKVTKTRVTLKGDSPFEQICSPELVKLCVAKIIRGEL